MIVEILRQTPISVWVILVMLIVLGFTQTRDRELSRTRIAVMPIAFMVLALSGVMRRAESLSINLAAWLLGFPAMWFFARKLVSVQGAILSPNRKHAYVPGSWVPMTLIVGLFVTNYAVAAVTALHPGLASGAPYSMSSNLVFGIFAGLFWNRSWSLQQIGVQS